MTALCLQAASQTPESAAEQAAAALVESSADQKAAETKPDYWTRSLGINVGLSQTGLVNWAAGGNNTISLTAGLDGKIDFEKDLTTWNNRLQLDYGFLWSSDKANLLQKSNDRIYLESKFAYKTAAKSKWNYTASLDFRSQFSDTRDNYQQGEDGKWVGTLKSSIFAPAYTNLALGMEWKPTSWFNVNIAPLTGGFTICRIDELKASYGMKLKDPENPDAGYRGLLFQFGAQIKANAKFEINDKFGYETQLVLFTDYLNKPFVYNRINWDNKISWQISKLFRLGLDTWLIYDPLVTIDGKTSRVQFKEFFSVSFTYLIRNKQ